MWLGVRVMSVLFLQPQVNLSLCCTPCHYSAQQTSNPYQNISHHAICLRNADVCPDPANCPVTTDITPGFCVRPFLLRHLPLKRAHNIPPVVTVTLPQRQAVLKPPLYRPFCYSHGICHHLHPLLMQTASHCHYENSAGVVTVWNRLPENPPREKNKRKNKTGFLERQKTNLVFLCASFREIQTHLRKRSETFLCVHPSSWWQVCWSLTEQTVSSQKQASFFWCCE